MALLLHLSDTHFGTEIPAVVAALLDLSRRLKPDVAVLSGDVTQRARRAQFEAAATFMQALQAHAKLVLPGNHDLPLFNLWGRCTAPYAGFERVFGPHGDVVIDTPTFLVLGVDTTRPWRHQAGEVSRQQVSDTAQRLRKARPGQLKVVVTHQPLAVITPRDHRNLLRGGELAIKAWREAGADLMLGGHIHLPYAVPLALQHGDRTHGARPWVVQAGTATSTRLRGGWPNMVNVIEWQPPGQGSPGRGCCWLMQYHYVTAARCFAQAGPPLVVRAG